MSEAIALLRMILITPNAPLKNENDNRFHSQKRARARGWHEQKRARET